VAANLFQFQANYSTKLGQPTAAYCY